jgi:chemotaxis protein MotB
MKQDKIIIKKVKKVVGGGHHGGEWKVAYADFITAMMAFFLLMWLIAILSPEKKEHMAQYFKEFSFMQNGGSGFMDSNSGVTAGSSSSAKMNFTSELVRGGPNQLTQEEVRDKLKKDIENKMAQVKDQILVDIFEGGIRIQIIDKEGQPMFTLGSPELTPTAKGIIKVIGKTIIGMNNDVAIEGHTDALNYSSTHYTNWELSTERASAARKALENEGLDPNRLVRVAGYASKEPLIKDNPNDPRNRRISIIMLYKSLKDARMPLPGSGLPADLIAPQKNKPIEPLQSNSPAPGNKASTTSGH